MDSGSTYTDPRHLPVGPGTSSARSHTHASHLEQQVEFRHGKIYGPGNVRHIHSARHTAPSIGDVSHLVFVSTWTARGVFPRGPLVTNALAALPCSAISSYQSRFWGYTGFRAAGSTNGLL